MCSNGLNSGEKPAVSPMSGSPIFNMGNKKKRGESITPPRPTGKQSNKEQVLLTR